MKIINLDLPEAVQANQLFKMSLTLELEETIEAGGKIAVAAKHVSDLAYAQDNNPLGENYVSIENINNDSTWELDAKNKMYRHPWNRGFEFILKGGRAAIGDKIIINMGEQKGFRCQSFIEEKFYFRLAILAKKDAKWEIIPCEVSPNFKIEPAKAVRMKVHVKNVNASKKNGIISIKLEDIYGNPASAGECEMNLLLDDQTFIKRIKICEGMQEIKEIPMPLDDKWHRITAVTDDGHFYAKSNPFSKNSLADGYKLFWGDLHCMSGICCGTGTPAYLYEYGRKAAGIDFAAVTSIDFFMDDDDWEQVKRETKNAYIPHEYVSILAYEWGGSTDRGGDNNIYFIGDEGKFIKSGNGGPYVLPEWCAKIHDFDKVRTLTDVIEELGDRDVIIIPHYGGRGCNFNFYDSKMIPVLEIHSNHRNFEDLAHKVIKKGIKVGFIADSDDHRGALGDSVPAARSHYMASQNGLVGLYSIDLTRKGIFEALRAKRVYATNGCRTALVFKANDTIMGGELEVPVGNEIDLSFDAVIDGTFEHAELVCQTKEIKRFSNHKNITLTYNGQV